MRNADAARGNRVDPEEEPPGPSASLIDRLGGYRVRRSWLRLFWLAVVLALSLIHI